MKEAKRIELGKYIVSDPEICHGQLTFNGTRLLVKDALYFVAKGYDWNSISKEFYDLPHEAIAEAVELASQALIDRVGNAQTPVKPSEKRKRAA
ncbi:MAG: DUF433 domain-containing protein [Acidobacteria bacterium]|nr:DUF433 domain-containing protein [Acidobacteriota bacterium]